MSPTILILGMSRCGTQSIADSLESIGEGPIYHMREVAVNGHIQAWCDLMDKKFKTKEPISKDELDALLGNFNGLADFPASIFATELIQHYPEAHDVLNDRDEDAWVNSMTRTVWKAYSNPSPNQRTDMLEFRNKYNEYCWKGDFPKYGREYFRQYKKEVREAGGDRVIEYDVTQGWAPLCKMLGKPIPDTPFLNNDEARTSGGPTQALHEQKQQQAMVEAAH